MMSPPDSLPALEVCNKEKVAIRSKEGRFSSRGILKAGPVNLRLLTSWYTISGQSKSAEVTYAVTVETGKIQGASVWRDRCIRIALRVSRVSKLNIIGA